MVRLTKQEQLVLCVILLLLLTGWAVKVYRTAHPPAPRQSERVQPEAPSITEQRAYR